MRTRSPRPAPRARLWPLVLVGLFAGPAAASPPRGLEEAQPLGRYRVRHWRLDEGLPQSSINDLAQTPDGRLWLATFGGLVAFDGLAFETFDLTSGLVSPRLTALAVAPDGRLAIGHQRAGISIFGPRGFETVPLPATGLEPTVDALAWRGEELWVARTDGAYVLFREAAPVRVLEGHQRYLGPAVDGVMLVGGPEGTTQVGAEGAERIAAGPRRWSTSGPSETSTSAARWWLGARGLQRGRGTRTSTVVAWPEPSLPESAPVVDPRGALWFAVRDRVYRLTADSFEVLAVGATVETILVDRERSVWVGTQGAGLWQLTPEPFENLSAAAGLPASPVRAVLPDGAGGIWVSSGCEAVVRLVGGRVKDRLLEDRCTYALALARDGSLWAGTTQLEQYRDGVRVRTLLAGALPHHVTALLEDSRGRLWVGTEASGLFSVVDGELAPALPSRGPVTALAEDAKGEVWVGQSGWVSRLGGSTREDLGPDDGVPAGQVRAILPGPGGEVWVGSYGGGLARLGARPSKYGPKEGLPDAFLSGLAIVEGQLWANTNQGLVRVPLAGFEAFDEGALRQLPAQLLRTGEAMSAHPSIVRLDAQSLALTTIAGAVRVDVARVTDNPALPRARLLDVRVDEVELTASRTEPVPPGPGRLEASFSAAMLDHPLRTTYEYRLRGLHETWRRTPPPGRARYDSLPPGRYTLEVRAVSESERAGPVAALSFTLAPFLYQTRAFQGGVGALLLALLWLAHRARTRLIERNNEALRTEISQRRAAEASMEASERHYRRVFEASANGLFIVDPGDRVRDVNPHGCELLGRRREEILGHSVWGLLEGTTGEGQPTQPEDSTGGLRLCRRADGTELEVRVATRPFTDVDRLVVVTDVSAVLRAQIEEQRLREQLLHSQRVEAVGRLAGGVAHEVNNLLTAIQGYAELARDHLVSGGESGPAIEMIDEVRHGAHQTAKITRQLLDFAREGPANVGPISVERVLQSMQPMLRRLSRDDVNLSFAVDPALPAVRADSTQLEQVLLNLVLNAADALPDGGHIRIQARPVEPAEVHDVTLTGPHVRLTVEDDGVGMTPEVRNRVFDPFFTTKDIGEGTGLGMSAVHGIVTQLDGHITVHSERGVGSRFDIYLPTTAGVEVRAPATPEAPLTAPRALEVMYVDDDEGVREATQRMLERRGYPVSVHSHPAAALQAALDMDEPLDLLLTDVVMPGLNGPELARRIRERHPEAKVLYISGYPANTIDALEDYEDFLAKPYSPRRLYAAIDRLTGE